ncbi:hydantoinase B/oxoprolinase family protein [Chelatococcus reniformis]|uniref:5-oxoprolinase n=1 Tax=Chelatococcus reniformis TaxID=1494448 RepID=A0A916X6H8_9HYPH|nr:hydantoinase B/oxoprolinase family protein [Chelatococcus reniformis]GGC45236.1 5-oxoprolinase [Chelatococcus reniformis]
MASPTQASDFDPYMTAILANRVDGIIREMTNTLLRAARSGVINSARDFSCSICTGDNRLLASAEGLPIHIFGSHMQARTMTDNAGAGLREGDCYLHNDPYTGNSHAGDHTFLVPVFVDGEHLFTTVAKAHQADIGNSLPTTYMAGARDQYEEGALIFPAVKIQSGYEMVDDVVRMCRSRIRVPDQWYGDFLAGIGSARIGERRLKELCAKYGTATIKSFIEHWMHYAEQRMAAAIQALPAATLTNTGNHDPFGDLLPDGIPLKASLTIDPADGYIDVDLRDNVDNVPCGFNQSAACASASVMAGIFNSIRADVPRNSGSFSRIRIHIRQGSVCGGPVFPASCSLATTNVSDRMVNLVQAAFAQIGDGWGLAEGGIGMGAGCAVVSGRDPRLDGTPFVNQLFLTNSGGPASAVADGWVTYGLPVAAGLMYRDSVEIDELKHPIDVQYVRLITGTGGAGRFRGAPSMETGYVARCPRMEVIWPCDGTHFPPQGACGGHAGAQADHRLVRADGSVEALPNIVVLALDEGDRVEGWQTGGGGYGNPFERDPKRVLHDVLEGWETTERAREVYGVALTGAVDDETLAIDAAATAHLRRAAA